MPAPKRGNKPNLDNYVEVADRIKMFYEKYPEGSLQAAGPPQIMDLEGQTFLVYSALAFRTPDDQRPGQGTAWEPVPGKTPYTKDSEMMNAETSAWGRAIAALGIGLTADGKIASREEVANRTGGPAPTPAAPKGSPILVAETANELQQYRVSAATEEEGTRRRGEILNLLTAAGASVNEGMSISQMLGTLTDARLKTVLDWARNKTKNAPIPEDENPDDDAAA